MSLDAERLLARYSPQDDLDTERHNAKRRQHTANRWHHPINYRAG